MPARCMLSVLCEQLIIAAMCGINERNLKELIAVR